MKIKERKKQTTSQNTTTIKKNPNIHRGMTSLISHFGFNANRGKKNLAKNKAVKFKYFCFTDYGRTKTKSNILRTTV